MPKCQCDRDGSKGCFPCYDHSCWHPRKSWDPKLRNGKTSSRDLFPVPVPLFPFFFSSSSIVFSLSLSLSFSLFGCVSIPLICFFLSRSSCCCNLRFFTYYQHQTSRDSLQLFYVRHNIRTTCHSYSHFQRIPFLVDRASQTNFLRINRQILVSLARSKGNKKFTEKENHKKHTIRYPR